MKKLVLICALIIAVIVSKTAFGQEKPLEGKSNKEMKADTTTVCKHQKDKPCQRSGHKGKTECSKDTKCCEKCKTMHEKEFKEKHKVKKDIEKKIEQKEEVKPKETK